MKLDSRYPSFAYLSKKAKARVPHFAWEYLDSGTGLEELVSRNMQKMDEIRLTPTVLMGSFEPDTRATLFGTEYSVPFGAAPVGMSSLIWPGAELALARAAASRRMPYVLSTMANETPEKIGEIAGDAAWFQLYPPKNDEVRSDILRRVRNAGMKTLVLTVDTPVGSRRERQLRAGLTVPASLSLAMLRDIAVRPNWALATLKNRAPRFKVIEKYYPASSTAKGAAAVGQVIGGRPLWEDVARLRDEWGGTLVLKGILDPADASRAVEAGADGIVVSNHGGRQIDAAPASIEALPAIAAEVKGRIPILFDSGLRGGLDILRALSLGADFCFLGRGFLFSIAALGERGAVHAYEILKTDLANNMAQLGVRNLAEVSRTT
ncbi:alpha-hydroxy acid oxidase [Mesorhizobium sp. CAU 1732]|uniref:alpha-hydroxy acid oxidase n=1 Tax=Mesorhizobium sp. CAU 1732 TaxID=3140358 RepID=UPI0032610F57